MLTDGRSPSMCLAYDEENDEKAHTAANNVGDIAGV
jgi:hypothetical protein